MLPDFTTFFRALWDRDPFPWQIMLADRAVEEGWPDAIDLPTASGKTACLDIAVWALAAQAEKPRGERTAARRIWFVVDRRIVVDEAFERAEALAKKLEAPEDSVLCAIAERLLKLRGLDPKIKKRPLAVGRLRGGVLRDDRWARVPSQAAILTSTVDQIGSRLLFRGYGHSALAAPIFAGLAGNDSLIFLDEAHCAQPFLQTLRAVQMFRSAKWSEAANPTPFHVAVLSATPPGEDDGQELETFPLNENERTQALDHEELQKRLRATKRAVLEPVKDEEKLTEKIASAAEAFARGGTPRVGVIVNRVARAMEIAAALRAKARENSPDGEQPDFDVELLTGRIRPVERDTLVGEKLHPFLHSSPKQNPVRPLILVSTQCLEVGADFSFDALVTECASLDSLRQRFGRLARLGKPETSHALIVTVESAMKESDPIYGDALKATWDFLWSKAIVETRASGKKGAEERSVDFGFESLRALLPPADSKELHAMLAPSSDAPILLPAHLDLLCQTAPRPHPDPDIGVFLHGKGRKSAEVRVAFRCDFDPFDDRNWPEIASLCPPVASEMFSLPLHRFRRWLQNRESTDASGDVEGERGDTEEGQSSRTSTTKFLLYCGREKSRVSNDADEILPDSVIILPAPRDEDGVAEVRKLGQLSRPEVSTREARTVWAWCGRGFGTEKLDLWELAAQSAGKQPALRIHRECLAPWLDGCPPLRALLDLVESGEWMVGELRDALTAVREWKPEDESTRQLPDWLLKLFNDTAEFRVRDIAQHPGRGILLRGKKRDIGPDETDYFSDEDDVPSEAPDEVPLAVHCSQVATAAAKLAHACLGPDAVAIAKTAGDWHDAGKLDPRFQVMLRNGAPTDDTAQPLAKSPCKPRSQAQARAIREAAGLPDDFRHEMLSTQVAERFCKAGFSPADRDLVLHLIASHHGHARPFAPICVDDALPAIEGQLDCGSLALSDAERRALTPSHRLDSGITDRFWLLTRRLGWWGLTYWEAILRLADWYASEHPDTSHPTNSACQGCRPLKNTAAMSEPLELSALDGANPLGFLAALGTLVTLVEAGESSARLSWKGGAAWRPSLTGLRDPDAICSILAAELRGREVAAEAEDARAEAQKRFEAASARLKKAKEGFKKRKLRGKERTDAYATEISPLEEDLRVCRKQFLERLNKGVPRPELSIGKKVDLSAQEFRTKAKQFRNDDPNLSALTMLAALASEGGRDDRSHRTDFDFVDSSGRLAFLETARQLMSLTTPDRLHATLFKPWRRADERWSLRFDPVEDRRYALLDRDPTANDNKSRSEWMANILAYRALGLFPCAITPKGPATAGWNSVSNEPCFTWPIWQAPLAADSIRSLLGHQALIAQRLPPSLRLFGIAAIYRSRRIQNGDYVNFSPALGVL
jgi:CRISPR-associated endonuclease/helicase Cas3